MSREEFLCLHKHCKEAETWKFCHHGTVCFVLVLRWWCCQVSHRTVLVARPDMAGWCSNCRRRIHRRRRRCRADIEKRCGLRPPWRRRRRQWRQQRKRRHRLRRAGQRRRSGEARRHDDSAFQLKSPLLPLPIVSWVLSIESATMFFLLFHVSYHWLTYATQKKSPITDQNSYQQTIIDRFAKY